VCQYNPPWVASMFDPWYEHGARFPCNFFAAARGSLPLLFWNLSSVGIIPCASTRRFKTSRIPALWIFGAEPLTPCSLRVSLMCLAISFRVFSIVSDNYNGRRWSFLQARCSGRMSSHSAPDNCCCGDMSPTCIVGMGVWTQASSLPVPLVEGASSLSRRDGASFR